MFVHYILSYLKWRKTSQPSIAAYNSQLASNYFGTVTGWRMSFTGDAFQAVPEDRSQVP